MYFSFTEKVSGLIWDQGVSGKPPVEMNVVAPVSEDVWIPRHDSLSCVLTRKENLGIDIGRVKVVLS